MIGQNNVTAIPGDAIVGVACLGMPPFSSAGFWYEVDDTGLDAIWTEIKPTDSFVIYKGDQNAT